MMTHVTDRGLCITLILIIIILFLPWTSVKDTCFFQGIKACDVNCLLILYLSFVFIRRLLLEKDFSFSLSNLDVVVLCYSCYLFLLVLLSWKRLDKEVILSYLACGLLYIAARNLSKRQIEQVLILFPLLLVLQLWYGIAKQTFYFYPGMDIGLIHGSFFNTGIWSCFVACVTILMCGQICMKTSWRVKIIYGLGVLISLVLLFVGNSRAAWLGFVVAGGYLLWKQIKKIRKSTFWLFTLILVGLIVSVSVCTWHKSDSALGRMLIWKISGKMCLEKPLGLGIDGFRQEYMEYQKQYFEKGGSDKEKMLADDNSFVFNELLKVLVEQGILGLIFIFLLVYYIFRGNEIPESGLLQILRGGLLTWMVFSFFSYPSSIFQAKAIFVLFLGMLSSLNKKVWKSSWKRLVLLGLTITLIMGVRESYSYRKAVKVWNICFRNREIPTKNVYTSLSPLMNTPYFLSNASLFLNEKKEFELAETIARRGVSLYHSYGCYIELGIALEKQGEFLLAEKSWIEAENLIPNRFKPLYLQMEMWIKKGDEKQSMELANRLSTKKIKVLSPELLYYLDRAKNVNFKTKCL